MFALITAAGVCLHGLAGDVARELLGETSMLATDIANNIGEAIALARKSARSKLFYMQL
jgi:NAD(P)H-hydrate repair Nnr-like enzyme with NAD(P)H-hydrate dehydratase domain